MTREEFKARLFCACNTVINHEDDLTEIDSKYGDGDHGQSMSEICRTIRDEASASLGGIKAMLNNCAIGVIGLSGGSSIALWNSWLDGMQEAAPEGDFADILDLKDIFRSGLLEIGGISGANVGDKTMMDALIPATNCILYYEGQDEQEMLDFAGIAALQGADDTRNYVSRFGRAKRFGAKTVGTPDCGALSMAYFIYGFSKAVPKAEED